MTIKTERPLPEEPQHLTCSVCLNEIPPSVGETLEGPDYVQHFCGIDCMDLWRRAQPRQNAPERS